MREANGCRKYDQLVQQYDELADLTQKKRLSQAGNDGTYGYLKLRVLGDELRDVIQAMDVKVFLSLSLLTTDCSRVTRLRF